MARIRSIHPDALKSRKLSAISAEAERLFWRLLTHLDDEGRGEDDAALLAAWLFPLITEADPTAVTEWMDELVRVGLVIRYRARGMDLIQCMEWGTYQHPKRKVASKLPPVDSTVENDYEASTDSTHASPDSTSSPHCSPIVSPVVPTEWRGEEWSGVGEGGEFEGRDADTAAVRAKADSILSRVTAPDLRAVQ